MKFLKPTTLKDKLSLIIPSWIAFFIAVSVYSENEFVSLFVGMFAIAITIYVLLYNDSKSLGKGKVVQSQLKYLGGGELSKEKDVQVYISNKGLKYDNYFIPIEKIKSAHIENQSQIRSRLTVTRMLAFGIFALATPKHKSTNEKYLSIEVSGQFDSTLIFGGKEVTKIYSALLRIKNSSPVTELENSYDR